MSVSNEKLFNLSSMSLGQKGILVAFSVDTEEGERIDKLGFSPGEQVEIVRYVQPEDLFEIKVRGYFFTLTKLQADRIKVKLFY